MQVGIAKEFDEGKIQRDERGRFSAFAAAQSVANEAMGRATAARNAVQLATDHEQKATAMRAAASESRAAATKLKESAKAARAAKLAPVAAMHSKLARDATRQANQLDKKAAAAAAAALYDKAGVAHRAADELSARRVELGTTAGYDHHRAASTAHSQAAGRYREAYEAAKAAGDTKLRDAADAARVEHRAQSDWHEYRADLHEDALKAESQVKAHEQALERARTEAGLVAARSPGSRDAIQAYERVAHSAMQLRDAAQKAALAHRDVDPDSAASGRMRQAVAAAKTRIDIALDVTAQHTERWARDLAMRARTPEDLRNAADAWKAVHLAFAMGSTAAREAGNTVGAEQSSGYAHAARAEAERLTREAESRAAREAANARARQTVDGRRATAQAHQQVARSLSAGANRARPPTNEAEHDQSINAHRQAIDAHRQAIQSVRAAGIRGSAVASHLRAISAHQTAVLGLTNDRDRVRAGIEPNTGRPGGPHVPLDKSALQRLGIDSFGDVKGVAERLFKRGVPSLNDLHGAFSSDKAFTKINTVSVDFDGNLKVSGIFHASDGRRLGRITRTFMDNGRGLEVHHDLLKFDNEKDEATGVGRSLLKQMLPTYQDWGVRQIHLTSAWRGRYMWARMGFDYRDGNQSYDRSSIERRLTGFLTDRGVASADAANIAKAASTSLNGVARLKVPGVERTKTIGTGRDKREITMGAGHWFLTHDGPNEAPGYSAKLQLDDPNDPGYKIAKEYLGLTR